MHNSLILLLSIASAIISSTNTNNQLAGLQNDWITLTPRSKHSVSQTQ